MRLYFQKGDMVAIGLVLLLAAAVFACFLPSQNAEGSVAEIYCEDTLIRVVSLDEDQTFTVSGAYGNTITVRDGKIAVTESDCPGGDCVSCGWSDSAGRSIVCLPNRLEIRIVGESGDVDFVVR